MIVLGIAGRKRCGKDMIADMIADAVVEWKYPIGVVKLGFADALYREVACGIVIQNTHNLRDLLEGECTCIREEMTLDYIIANMKKNKVNFRLILQGWGTDFRRKLCGDNYWLLKWEKELLKLPDNTLVIVPDVRFTNEYELIKRIGGHVWKVTRDVGKIDLHESEQQLKDLEVEVLIRNDFDLGYLRQTVKGHLITLLNK